MYCTNVRSMCAMDQGGFRSQGLVIYFLFRLGSFCPLRAGGSVGG